MRLFAEKKRKKREEKNKKKREEEKEDIYPDADEFYSIGWRDKEKDKKNDTESENTE